MSLFLVEDTIRRDLFVFCFHPINKKYILADLIHNYFEQIFGLFIVSRIIFQNFSLF